MEPVDRRGFLRKATVGAAVGVVGSQVAGAGAANAVIKSAGAELLDPVDAGEDRVVAFVKAGSRDEVTILAGEREIVQRDPALARSLLRAARPR
jgi:outer membrane lipoprotein SlyB